jgi:hypothetical protein
MPKIEGRKVIAQKNLPMRIPLWPTLTTWLLLDRFHAPEWLAGIMIFLIAFAWLVWFRDMYTRVDVDVLTNRRE